MLLSVYLGNYRRFDVEYDDYNNPIENRLGTVITTQNRYFEGDEILDEDWETKRAEIESDGGVVIALEATIHGGIYLRHVDRPVRDWDTGIIGYHYATREKINEWFGDVNEFELLARIIDRLVIELKELNDYHEYGAFYGALREFDVKTGDFEITDSCGGFLTDGDYSVMLKEMFECLPITDAEQKLILEKANNL